MKHLIHGIIAACALGTGHSAEAQSISGNELLETCSSDDDVYAGFCIGYILGAIEGESFGAFVVVNSLTPGLDTDDTNRTISSYLQHCTPSDASNQQLRDIMVKYLAEHPAQRHNSARGLILKALRDAFPCD